MFKKTIATAVAASVIFGAGLSNPVKAAVSSDLRMIPVIVNGQKVKFPDTEPFINTDGRTMVPVRFVSERLGADVTWESDTETAVIKYNGKEIRMPIGSNQVSVNGQAVELDTQAELYEGRTMVPLRFVSEVLGSKVEWDNAAHSVRVTDVLYQNKVDAGQVVLDPWGREYSKNWDANWMKLTDLEGTSFYKEGLNAGKPNNRDYIGQSRDWDFKKYNDQWAERVRQYYISTLNIDYRTINESEITNAVIGNMSGMSNYAESQIRAAIKQYVGWVKKIWSLHVATQILKIHKFVKVADLQLCVLTSNS